MKRFALSAAVLVLVSVSIALAQRDNATKADAAEGVLTELKAGEWITLDPESGRFAITVVEPVEGRTISEYRTEQGRLLQERNKIKKDAESAFLDAQQRFQIGRGRQEELDAARKQREAAMTAIKIAEPDFRVLWEVSEIRSDFVKLANGERIIAIPDDSIRYISRDID